jgi:hypothetical protein
VRSVFSQSVRCPLSPRAPSGRSLIAAFGALVLSVGVALTGLVATAPAASASSSTVEAAIGWAGIHLGDGTKFDDGLCQTFVHAAYLSAGVDIGSTGGGNGAVDYWNEHASVQHRGDVNPPRGALVYWGASDIGGVNNPFGHVGISLGGGEVISTYSYPKTTAEKHDVHEFSIAVRNAAGYPYLGWLTPPGVDLGGGAAGLSNGSLISNNGMVYRIAGGAPTYISSWSAIGGAQPTTAVSDAQLGALRQYPADGTFVSVASGAVYRFVGGAPTYVSSWDAVGGPQPVTVIDQAAIDNADGGSPWNHIHRYPADGTFVSTRAGSVYRFVGGAPVYVSTWDAVGGPQPVTVIDQAAIDNADGGSPWNHIHRYPAGGSFILSGQTGEVFRVNGHGVAVYVPSWAPYGGEQPTVTEDQAAIDRAGLASPWDHLATGIPTVSMVRHSSAKTRRAIFAFSWSAPIQSSAVTTFDVRYRQEKRGHRAGRWIQPTRWQHITVTSGHLSMRRGHTYSIEVRAHNVAGAAPRWTKPQNLTRT